MGLLPLPDCVTGVRARPLPDRESEGAGRPVGRPTGAMLTGFGTVLVFLVAGAAFVAVALVLQRFLAPRTPGPEKALTYECGEDPQGKAWVQFNIRFYVFALAFLIFDVEVAFLLPWAVAYRHLETEGMRWVGFADGVVFALILFVGLIYAWAKGHLEWVKPRLRFPEHPQPPTEEERPEAV